MSTNPSAFGNAPTGPAGGALGGTYPNPTLSTASLLAEPSWVPADAGYQAWAYDPALCSATTVLTTANVNLIRVNVRAGFSVSNVTVIVTAAGGTLTSAENFVGLYSSAGTQIGVSADQTTNWGSANNNPIPLTGGPFALSAGFYWVAVLTNGTTGISLATTAIGTFRAVNLGTAASVARFATNGTGTTLPGSITPGSNALASSAWWAGLS